MTQPRTSSSPDVFSRRVEAAVPEALDYLPLTWAARERLARELVERVLAAADQAVPAVSDEMVERAAKALYCEHYFEPPQPGDDRWEDYGGRDAYRMIARDMLRSALSEPAAEGSGEDG